MRAPLLVLLMVATAACGAYRFPGESPSATGTVSGHVLAVPCAPVQPANQPQCAGRPVGGLEIDFTANGATVGTKTGSNGAYSVELAVGTWKVSLASYMRIISGPPTVTVPAGSSVVADYLVDSGIRVPVGSDSAIHFPDQ
jgi:hypothetical protein